MKTLKVNIDIEFCSYDELAQQDQLLVDAAISATANSYANYSHFNVGAAIRLSDGSIVIGANQENAAFPSGLCAERTAIFAAQAQHPECAITTLAIAARNEHGLTPNPISPCGGCRQVIMEVEQRYKKPVRTLLYGTKGIYCIKSAADLMPLSFVDADMKQ